jgi:hypothetical protein
MNRSISAIARDIKRVWVKPYFGAKPYLDAMMQLNTINDKYIFDSGESVVMYFLANASTFRGNDAKVLKQELKNILKGV